jgi:metal-responsive CopG/Arc/MetJ family transcriptional regulator
MAKKRKVRARAPGMTQISISLPEGLVGKIDEMADAENRNRSNFIATVLESLSGERGVKTAEGSKRFGA